MRKTYKGNADLRRTIGNVFISLSIVSMLIIFFPVIKEEISFRTASSISIEPQSEEFNILIPTIGVNTPVIKNVDPWKQVEYLDVLKKGVAHAKDTATPDIAGTVFLFAHSSDVPWRMTRYNTAFFRLPRIRPNDIIVITYKGKDYSYRTVQKKVVWPNEVKYLLDQDTNQLILQTCTPIGTSLKRLLVFAEPFSIAASDTIESH